MTTRELQARQRREQFLQVALELFAEQGFEETSIKDLARCAHVTEGLLYHYFRSKEELLFAVIERESFLPRLRELFDETNTGSVDQVLQEFAASFSLLLSQKHHLVRILFREAQTNQTIALWFGQFTQQGVTTLARFLQMRIETGELRPHNTEVTARSLFYTLVMHQLLRSANSDFFPELIENVLRGIQAS